MKALVVVAAVLLSACGSSSTTTPTPIPVQPTPIPELISITSGDLGDVPQLATGFASDAPERIISLANGIGETLVALGAQERIVGRDETSDIPELVDIPVVTKAHSVSAERVLSLSPDLVLIDSATGPPEVIDQIRASGARVVQVPDAWTIKDINPRAQVVAEAIGATGFQPMVFATPTATDDSLPRVAFLYLRGASAIYLLGGEESGADALIAAAGGTDVGAQAGYPAFTPLTAEALAAANPDVLLVMDKGLASVGGVEGLLALPGVQQTSAAQQRRVISVDDGVLLSFGPRTPALVEQLRLAIEQYT